MRENGWIFKKYKTWSYIYIYIMMCQLEMKKGNGEKIEVKKDRKFNTNIVCKLQSMIGNGQYVENLCCMH